MVCQVAGCGKDEKAHRLMAHQFQPEVGYLEAKHQPNPNMMVAADAVLRMTLVRKGLITYDELAETEKELRAAGLLGGNGVRKQEGDSGDRKVRDNPQA